MPNEIIILTTLPSLNQGFYGVRAEGAEQCDRGPVFIDASLANLTGPEAAALGAARAVLLAVATAHATTDGPLPEGQRVEVVTTKPDLDEIEYAIFPANAPKPVKHGEVLAVPLAELTAPNRQAILDARAAILRLATLDAKTKGLLDN